MNQVLLAWAVLANGSQSASHLSPPTSDTNLAQEHAGRADLVPDDTIVIRTVVLDMAMYDGQDFELSLFKGSRRMILVDTTPGRADEDTEHQMNGELDMKKADDIDLDMRRDLLRRNSAPVSLKGLLFSDARISLNPKSAIPAGLPVGKEAPYRGWVEAMLPGYSADMTKAAFHCSFGPTPHGASATYLLTKKNGAWTVVWREFAHHV